MKRKVTTAAAVLSLALAMGSCVAAFRLMDALFLRPLLIAHADRLYVLSRQVIDQTGAPHDDDHWAYPDFVRMRDVSKKDVALIAVPFTERYDLTYKTVEEMEKGYVQYVSGSMFSSYGLQPTLGRLLTDGTDRSERSLMVEPAERFSRTRITFARKSTLCHPRCIASLMRRPVCSSSLKATRLKSVWHAAKNVFFSS